MKFFAGSPMGHRELLYEMHFHDVGERPLRDDPSSPTHVYRLMWIPSFHPFAVVRIEDAGRGYRLEAKRGPDAHRRESDHLPRESSFMLSDAEQQIFVDRWMPPRIGREVGFRALVEWMLAESGVVAASRVGL